MRCEWGRGGEAVPEDSPRRPRAATGPALRRASARTWRGACRDGPRAACAIASAERRAKAGEHGLLRRSRELQRRRGGVPRSAPPFPNSDRRRARRSLAARRRGPGPGGAWQPARSRRRATAGRSGDAGSSRFATRLFRYPRYLALSPS
ncbi:hypothetical protein D0T98_04670 [Burkholderia pseudomallei]|nr:hypothetical protein D0T98_04670 [Burkholderia pseudomallei]